MSDLLDLLGDEWAAPTWQALYRKAGGNQPPRCRDCGRTKFTGMCGGAGREGIYELCDDCAAIDGCDARAARLPHEVRAGSNVSHWGRRTTDEERTRLTALQSTRRQAWMEKNR